MSDRTASRTRQTPVAETPDAIRNVALVGCSATGKTTLAESLAFASGAIGRAGRVVDGTTVSDYEEIEQQHRRSVQLAVLPLEWKGIKINLIDTPGHPDFDADLRAGLHAADAAIFVVSATDPITAATRALWRECDEEKIPRAIVVTKLDIARAQLRRTARAVPRCLRSRPRHGARVVLSGVRRGSSGRVDGPADRP